MAAHPPQNNLRALRHVYTANDLLGGQSVITKVREGAQTTYSGGVAIDTIYGRSTLDEHPSLRGADGRSDATRVCHVLGAGAARPGGTVCRVVDLAPLHECAMSRGHNIDYAAVIEGSVVLSLDSNQETRLGRGDVVVQRAAKHVWRNPSETDWARVFFVLQDCPQPPASGSSCYI